MVISTKLHASKKLTNIVSLSFCQIVYSLHSLQKKISCLEKFQKLELEKASYLIFHFN